MPRIFSGIFGATALILSGCDCGGPRLMPHSEFDAGEDAAVVSGVDGGNDAGPSMDAGVPDAGICDAGMADAGIDDAGIEDAGVVDAGTPDAGPEDAGAPDAGPRSCDPGERRCQGTVGEVCSADGQGFETDTSAIGCEFWPFILAYNLFGYSGGNQYAVTIANTGTLTATVTLEGGMLTSPTVFSVQPGGVWVQGLSDRAASIPFHLTSTQPVSAVQFTPLHASIGGFHNYSADSSLLQPTHAWGTRYVAVSWPQYESVAPSLIGVVVRQATDVRITATADTVGKGQAPALVAHVPTTVHLDAGTVIELGSITGDLTGTLLESTQPIGVIVGHYGAKIPANVDAADRLEEGLPSVDHLGTDHFIVAPALPTIPLGKAQVVRVVAAEPDVDLTYEPAQPGAPTHLQNLGDFIELLPSANAYRLRATKAVIVAQYMQSQAVGGGMGDPAMFFAPPVSRYETRYAFHAPADYTANGIDVVAPTGTTVTLDGVPVTGFVAIGTTGYALARVVGFGDGPQANGNHLIVGSAPFSLSIYGYGDYASYWHPGG